MIAETQSDSIRVALVDDDPLARLWLRDRLREVAHIELVGEASGVGEALMLAAKVPLDVMLVDIAMRDMTGITLTTHLTKRHPDVRVLIFSSHDKVTYVTSAAGAGACGYLLKSLDPKEVIRAVEAVARGNAYYGAGVPFPTQGRNLRRRPTAREAEVMRLIAKGLRNIQIAERLGIQVTTVMRHRMNLRDKLGLDGVIEIRRYAEDHGLLGE